MPCAFKIYIKTLLHSYLNFGTTWFSYNMSFHSPIKRWILCPVPLNLGEPLWLMQSIEFGRSYTMPFLSLDHERWYRLLLVLSHRTCPWNPSTMLWGSPRHLDRPLCSVLADRQHLLTDSMRHEKAFEVTPAPGTIWLHERPQVRTAQLSPTDT